MARRRCMFFWRALIGLFCMETNTAILSSADVLYSVDSKSRSPLLSLYRRSATASRPRHSTEWLSNYTLPVTIASSFSSKTSNRLNVMAIPRTCHQVYYEKASQLYRLNTFTFELPTLYKRNRYPISTPRLPQRSFNFNIMTLACRCIMHGVL